MNAVKGKVKSAGVPGGPEAAGGWDGRAGG